MKLLMHACCAPCSVYCIDELRKENIEPTLFWYNPNIHPFKEYEARRNCLVDYCKKINLECIVEDEYGLEKFCKNVIDDLDVRCSSYCYPVRLRKAFEYAKNNGYDVFAFFITDILKNGSYIYYNNDAQDIIAKAFQDETIEQGQYLDGVVSRKKQVIPKLMKALD